MTCPTIETVTVIGEAGVGVPVGVGVCAAAGATNVKANRSTREIASHFFI